MDSDNSNDQNKGTPGKRSASSSSQPSDSSNKRVKKDEEEQEVWKWWEEPGKDDGSPKKWESLQHNGPLFSPPYVRLPNNVSFRYEGNAIRLSEDAEEVAGFYARLIDHEYTTKKNFNDNFLMDWRESMNDKERETITNLKKCDFREIRDYYKTKSEERKSLSKEEKQKIKDDNEALVKQYGIAVIDGHQEKIGNFRVEPPGLFMGRGDHPKMGMLKKRIVPEDVIINCSKDNKIPEAPAGRQWKEVRHNNTVTWLACWKDNIMGHLKYIMFNQASRAKGEKDWMKFEKARELAKHIDKIRKNYMADLKNKEERIRQRAVALYLIDEFALRAGNEKGEDAADTVGCCSLRKEHIRLRQVGRKYMVTFDFKGKDSIQYKNKVKVEKQVFDNLKLFMQRKKKGDDLFDKLNTSSLNKYLNELMSGLTAKCFRTYNACHTLQEQLDELTPEDGTVAEKVKAYNKANRAVAILCNHQRTVPKTYEKSMETLMNKIQCKKAEIKEAKKALKKVNEETKDFENKSKKLKRLEDQLHNLEMKREEKEEGKEIALGTSKQNYIDPRIIVSWCKQHDVPNQKIYNKTQLSKFRWAVEMVSSDENDFRFV